MFNSILRFDFLFGLPQYSANPEIQLIYIFQSLFYLLIQFLQKGKY